MKENLLTTDGVSFKRLPEFSQADGVQKKVFAFSNGERILAAKIYRSRTDAGRLIDRQKEATVELNTYQRLKGSPLGIYVPEPACLISDAKEGIIGLAVEWRHGLALREWLNRYPLRYAEIDKLELLVIEVLSQNQITLDLDMLSEYNLCFDPKASPRIWFAECVLFDRYKNYVSYKRCVSNSLNYLRENYARPG